MAFMRNIIFPNKKKKPSGSQNESFAMPEKSVASKRSAAHNKQDDDKIIRVYSKSQGGPFEDQNIKIKLDLNGDYDFLKNKTKGGFDSIYEYDLDNKNSSFKRKRRDTPEKLYNELLGDIIDFCIRNDYSKLFLMPVKKKDYPDYFEIVKQPMDLGLWMGMPRGISTRLPSASSCETKLLITPTAPPISKHSPHSKV